MRLTFESSLLIGLLISATSCNPVRPPEDDEGRDLAGGGGGVDLGTTCKMDSDCGPKRRCHMGRCIPDNGTCCTDDDCQNDTRCSSQKTGDGGSCGICIEYKNGESDSMCQGQGFSAMEFRPPVDKCRWPAMGMNPPAKEVIMTPLVIDVDGDKLPEVVFGAQTGSTGPARLIAIRGRDCVPLYDVDAQLQPFSQIAAADLDGDKLPEIVGVLNSGVFGGGHKLGVFNGKTGVKMGESSDAYILNGSGFDCSGPAIADVDGDGTPEIAAAGLVTRWDKVQRRLLTVWNKSADAGTWGTLSLFNDMDGDGRLELVTGTKIFDGLTGMDKTPSVMSSLTKGGYPAIGDFNKDGHPDLVHVQSASGDQRVAIVDVKNNSFLFAPTVIPAGWGGPPTVADFDGDTRIEFGTAGPSNYFVFTPDCLAMPKPAKCKGTVPGALWQSATKDRSSGGTASSVFDFNGDGKAEVIYRDECWLRVYSGTDGKTLFARPITSGTALEMPVVADVDNDGHADLVVPSDAVQGMGYCSDQSPEKDTGMPHTGTTSGIFILTDPMNRWMPSRSMWNQHTYHITNINDDGTVPAKEMPNWTTFNNYRQNVQGLIGMPVPQPDLTGKSNPQLDRGDCVKVFKLYAQICNRGSTQVGAMVPGTFYKSDPRMGMLMPICTAKTKTPLDPGKCEVVTCDWLNPPMGSQDLWFRVNDDGMGGRPFPQCKNKNDMAFLPGVSCAVIPG